MKVTYKHTLYNREVTVHTAGEILFKEKGIEFNSMGRGQFVEYEYIVKIEEEE